MNTETEFIRSVRGQEAFTESSAEYVMPDYESDVRKILFCEAEVRPAGKFVGNDEVELNGIVVYNVIYSDSEGKISGVSFNSDYRLAVKCPTEGTESVFCEPTVTNFALRLLSPRKLSAKCSVSGTVRLNEREKISLLGDAIEREEIETSKGEVRLRLFNSTESKERELAEEIKKIEGAIEDEVKVVYVKATPRYVSVEELDGEYKLKCEIAVNALIQNGEESVIPCERSIEFEEMLPAFDRREGIKLSPSVLITSEKANVVPEEDGCSVVVSVIVESAVTGEENTLVEVVKDAYLTTSPTDNSYSDYRYTELIDSFSLEERHTAEIDRQQIEEGLIREIVFVKAEPRIESVQKESDTAKITASVKYSGIISEVNDDGSIRYSPIKFTAPYEKNVKFDCQNPDKITIEAKMSAVCADANMDANKIYLSSLFNTHLTLLEDKSERILTECSARVGEEYERCDATVTVYYPDESESLFDVAKRFHVSKERIRECNDGVVGAISDGEDIEVKRILIY